MTGVNELSASAMLAGELAERADELRGLQARVEREAAHHPRIDTSQWSGLASWACQRALEQLAREIDVSSELLRCAADLTAAAEWEARGHA